MWRISNGGDWAEGESNSVELNGNLSSGSVFVICNSQADDFIKDNSDSIGTDITYFNGDDAIGLAFNGILIDVVGTDGDDPGDGWSVAGEEDATKEHTLVRKPNVTAGNIDWASSAGIDANSSEWNVLEQNDWTNTVSYTHLTLPTICSV